MRYSLLVSSEENSFILHFESYSEAKLKEYELSKLLDQYTFKIVFTDLAYRLLVSQFISINETDN